MDGCVGVNEHEHESEHGRVLPAKSGLARGGGRGGSNARQNLMTFHMHPYGLLFLHVFSFPIGRILYYLLLKSNVARVEESIRPGVFHRREFWTSCAAGTVGIGGDTVGGGCWVY